jgi:hypothetical protein
MITRFIFVIFILTIIFNESDGKGNCKDSINWRREETVFRMLNKYKKKNLDECVLGIIDSLLYYSTTGDTLTLKILDKISSHSDGYLSEYFDYEIPKMFYKNPEFLIEWLFKNQKSKLRMFLIWGLSLNVNEFGKIELLKIEAVKIKLKKSLNSFEYRYFTKIILEINPKMWD